MWTGGLRWIWMSGDGAGAGGAFRRSGRPDTAPGGAESGELRPEAASDGGGGHGDDAQRDDLLSVNVHQCLLPRTARDNGTHR